MVYWQDTYSTFITQKVDVSPTKVHGHDLKIEGLRSKVVYPSKKCGEYAEMHKFVFGKIKHPRRKMLENSEKLKIANA